MKIGIHQPNFMPWEGYLDKMAKSDMFVFLDNVQYENNGYTNRTMIRSERGKKWLSFSIKHNFPQLIKDVEFADFQKDRDRILAIIDSNYRDGRGFDTIYPILCQMMSGDWKKLSDFNIKLIKELMLGLKHKPETRIASEYNFEGKSTELLINICKHFGADTYVSGSGGKNYQDDELFKKNGITVEYTDFNQIPYPQLWGDDFIPGLSIIDKLLNLPYIIV